MDYVYLDNAATTELLPEVIKKMNNLLTKKFGNPSSLHRLGIDAEKEIKQARGNIAEVLKVEPDDIIFAGSGSIANNIAIKGAVNRLKKFGNKIITTQIEHKSVLEIFKYFETQGLDVIYLPVNKDGVVNLDILKKELDDNTILVSIMAVNNETGVIQPLEKISALIKDYEDLYFHVDGIQALGKIDIDIKELNIDLFSMSAHKVHGPKGVGALYINKNIIIDKILHGSSQEKGLYPGTENTSGIVGFGEAVKHLPNSNELKKIEELKVNFTHKINDNIKEVKINTPIDGQSAPHILNVSFSKIKGEVLVHSLENEKIYVSTGSACSSKKDTTSHVIKAIGIPDKYKEGTIRFSFNKNITYEQIEYVFNVLQKNIINLRKIMR
ncbi:MAG: cysteine desulfurase family protein [Bacillota bacterium]